MHHLHIVFLLLGSTAARPNLQKQVENEIEEASNIPGMVKRNGHLYFNGEEVVGINGMGLSEEVIKEEPVISSKLVQNIEAVNRKENVDFMSEVLSKLPVRTLEEILSKDLVVNKQDIKSISPVSATEVKRLTPVDTMEEVVDMSEVVEKIPIPEEVYQRMMMKLEQQDFRTPNRMSADSPSYSESDIEEIDRKLEVARNQLVKAKDEVEAIERLLEKYEIKKLEMVQSTREIETQSEIDSMEEIRSQELVKKYNEVISMQEVMSKQEVESIKPVEVEEVVNIKQLNPAQERMLRNMLQNYN